MKVVTQRFILATVVAVLSVTSAQAAKLHVLVFADTLDSTVGKAATADAQQVEMTFQYGMDAGSLQLRSYHGKELTRENLLDAVNRLSLRIGDTVVVYYSGHGGKHATKGHFLALNGAERSRVYRSEITTALNRANPKFWALITDCCANLELPPNNNPPVYQTPAPGDEPSRKFRLFRKLFLNSTGRIDLQAARPEQVAFGPDTGSLFTTELCSVLNSDLDPAKEDWSTVFKAARKRTTSISGALLASQSEKFRHRGVPQEVQTPYSFRYINGKSANGLRLGVIHRNRKITKIAPGSPAEKAGLKPGMILESVNGRSVTSNAQFITAINFSRRICRLKVATGKGVREIPLELSY